MTVRRINTTEGEAVTFDDTTGDIGITGVITRLEKPQALQLASWLAEFGKPQHHVLEASPVVVMPPQQNHK